MPMRVHSLTVDKVGTIARVGAGSTVLHEGHTETGRLFADSRPTEATRPPLAIPTINADAAARCVNKRNGRLLFKNADLELLVGRRL